LRDDIPSPISINPGVPRALSDVVMTALHRSPEARFPTALAMAKALQGAIPSLISTAEEATAFMASLFAEPLSQTRTLFKLVDEQVDPGKLEAEAARLQEPAVVKVVAPAADEQRKAGPGTDVYGRLPTGVMKLPEVLAAEVQASPFEPSVEGAVVLSVDDSVISRDFIEAHLESSGFPVLHCGSAEEALKLISQRLPDLILLDVVMPGMNGFQLCRVLRQRCWQRPFLPILFLSSASSFHERLQGLEAGGDDFIQKPFHPEELIGLVRAHLKRAQFLEAQFKAARAPARRA
jgi:CheY-like chemotaxis protein